MSAVTSTNVNQILSDQLDKFQSILLDRQLEGWALFNWATEYVDSIKEYWNLEHILFLFYSANYYSKDIFEYIIEDAERWGLPQPSEVIEILKLPDAYELLSSSDTRERFEFNHTAFWISVECWANELAEHILTNSWIILNVDLMNRMIDYK